MKLVALPPEGEGAPTRATVAAVPAVAGVLTTPGVSAANDAKFRPEFGRFSTCSFATVKDRSPVCDWIMGASPDTVTVSSREPTSMVRLPMTTRSPGLTETPLRSVILKPVSVILTV